jgi:hypothetical protein
MQILEEYVLIEQDHLVIDSGLFIKTTYRLY